MVTKGNLSDECWISMVCLNGLMDEINKYLCQTWRTNNTLNNSLAQCDPFFQFPTIPIYSNHVHLFYKSVHLKPDVDLFFPPDYICYDQQLCSTMTADLVDGNLACTSYYTQTTRFLDPVNFWKLAMLSIENDFRSCSVSYTNSDYTTKYSNHRSLYSCQNSHKLISKHRIMDGIDNCREKDDEHYQGSCQLHDRYRANCRNMTMCWSPIVKNDACFLSGVKNMINIKFQSLCDGVQEYVYDAYGQEYTDELGCNSRTCNNMYSRCDGYWACSDGRDEYNCSSNICPQQTYPCISSVNHTLICLSSSFVNDGIVHCIGALDEQAFCRGRFPTDLVSYSFRCSENKQCLKLSQICDGVNDCKQSEEDEKFCNTSNLTCDQNSMHKYNSFEQLICELRKIEEKKVKQFSLYTSSKHPSLSGIITTSFKEPPMKNRSTHDNGIMSKIHHQPWPWYCIRGLVVRQWLTDKYKYTYGCLCPPSYYGDMCEYQNQRVSMILKLCSTDRHATYMIVIMLVNEDKQQEIETYDQFTYIVKKTCTNKINHYLLFSTRPKDYTKNYSIRVDAFDKKSLMHTGSWYFPISFVFLPVNRMGLSLNLSNDQNQVSSKCPMACIHGQCMNYVNKNASFCKCSAGWSGIQCNIPVNCDACSLGSICIGSTNSEAICVCSIYQFGQQCTMTSACPQSACQNNGECIPDDVSVSENSYTCLCPTQFFGEFCQYRKAELVVTLVKIPTPAYLLAYFYTLSNESDPIETILLRKFLLFQSTISFHIAAPFQLAFIKADENFYLAALQQTPMAYIPTSISPKEKCPSVDQLLNTTVLNLMPYQRMIHFYHLCLNNYELTCFIDKSYLCLCTNDHHANCLPFNSQKQLQCTQKKFCQNNGECLQDHSKCPATRICLCPSCYYGDVCQYYTKGMGTTLDEIIGYEIKSNTSFLKQSSPVYLTLAIIIILLIITILNSSKSLSLFARKAPREVGCGVYLFTSSATSIVIMVFLVMKFGFLFFSHQNFSGQEILLEINCYFIEPFLKSLLFYNNWLNTFVSIERSVAVIQHVNFNKRRSKRTALYVRIIAFVIILLFLIPQVVYTRTFHDKIEDRHWCVIKYVKWVEIWRTLFIHINYIVPILINITTLILIVTVTARQKHHAHHKQSYLFYFKAQIKKNRPTLLSTSAVILLTLPYVIISFALNCDRTTGIFWLSLIGFFLSFFPSAFVFLVYVLPSSTYRKEYQRMIRERIEKEIAKKANRGK